MILKVLALGVLVWAAFYLSAKAWKLFKLDGFVEGILTFFTSVMVLFIVNLFYYSPRYGGVVGYIDEASLSVSEPEAVRAELAAARAALAAYRADTKGYPESLDALWKEKKYLPQPLRRAEVFVPGKGMWSGLERAHWTWDTERIKAFATSARDADDAGGWGYVDNPSSPEFGTVFVNCTHVDPKTGIAWNLAKPPEPVNREITPKK